MTFERKIIVGIEDISAVSFECNGCKAKTTLMPDKLPPEIPYSCKHCGHTWRASVIDAPDVTRATFESFTRSMVSIRTLLREKALGFRILLEFDEPRGQQ